MNNKYIDNKLKQFDKDILPEMDESLPEAICSTAERILIKQYNAKRKYTRQFIKEALESVRNETIEEVRLSLWRGATRDEVHRRLDELKSEQEECNCHCHVCDCERQYAASCIADNVSCTHCQKPEERQKTYFKDCINCLDIEGHACHGHYLKEPEEQL